MSKASGRLTGSREPSPETVSALTGFDPGRVLREIFNRAWHDWRDAELRKDSYGEMHIPWSGDNLLELLVIDFERATASAGEAGTATDAEGGVAEGEHAVRDSADAPRTRP